MFHFAAIGDRSLSDYTLESEHFDNSSASTMSVYLVLRRRTQFHAVNAFVQTFVVLLASGATFFFDEDDFSDRILVNAVLLLACATINSSIQSVIVLQNGFKCKKM